LGKEGLVQEGDGYPQDSWCLIGSHIGTEMCIGVEGGVKVVKELKGRGGMV
jgi:hypothetical protein